MITRTCLARLTALLPALVLLPGLALGAPAGATAATSSRTVFGSNLATPNVGFGCDLAPTAGGLLKTGAADCIWAEVASGNSSLVGNDDIPGGTGTLTTARVHVGAVTGSMSFVMFRGFINVDNFNESCCVVLLRSKLFTPRANATTSETVNFPIVKNQTIVGDDIEAFDVLGLFVHSARTPIPLTNKTNLVINHRPADEALFGAVHPGTAQNFFDPLGYQVDIQGTFVKG